MVIHLRDLTSALHSPNPDFKPSSTSSFQRLQQGRSCKSSSGSTPTGSGRIPCSCGPSRNSILAWCSGTLGASLSPLAFRSPRLSYSSYLFSFRLFSQLHVSHVFSCFYSLDCLTSHIYSLFSFLAPYVA